MGTNTKCLILVVVACFSAGDAQYRQEIVFPGFGAQFQGETRVGGRPIQTTAGFNLNPPPPLTIIQSFPFSSALFSGNYRSGFLPPPPPFTNLFTPNTIRQPVESRGQAEEYKKAVDEEQRAETTTNADSSDGTTLGPQQNAFVKLHVQGKDYGYSTRQ
ncbi:uncharacterized protein LOC132701021 [Cylas formicarius]|uniref:uncharacterized protein LOC132701021 n=1 Tax=Cylas formicarius TaxID=197179 RepID=UPI0029584F67|nr:uncharacterized protein LOC132701021 [Cylas formicarius]